MEEEVVVVAEGPMAEVLKTQKVETEYCRRYSLPSVSSFSFSDYKVKPMPS